jgi:putative transposase
MNTPAVRYKRHRFPPQIISHAVWLYYRFPLSLRLVEEMLLERGIVVSYETIRRWAKKFGPNYAGRLRRKRPSRNDIWHLDEGIITIAGKKCWLWRAVDQNGYVLDEIVQNRRNTKAAKRLLTRLLKKQGLAPKRMITDKLRSYGAARRQVMPGVEHRSHKGLNNCREFARATTKAGTNNAGFPVTRKPSALRLCLLRHPKSLRPTPLKALRTPHPPSSPEGVGGMEGSDCGC